MMNLKKVSALLILVIGLTTLVACSNSEQGKADELEQPVVLATIAQIGEPLTHIAGDYVDVQTLMGSGIDPHLYQVTPSDVQLIEKSDAIIYNGLNLEANMVEVFDRMAEKKPVIAIAEQLDSSRLLMDEEGAIDPHVWFDLTLWAEALSEAVDTIISLVPEYKQEIEASRDDYMAQLSALHEQNSAAMHAIPDATRVLVTAHDAFQYFGRAYDIEVVGLQGLSTESEISLSTVQAIVNMLAERKVPAVFIESSVNPAAVQAVIEGAATQGHTVSLGGELFSDAMGAENEETGKYIGMYQHNINTIVGALRTEE